MAVFAPDAESVGIGAWEIANLSPKWIDFCSSVIYAHPPWFETTLGGPLDHLSFERLPGSALVPATAALSARLDP